MHHPLYQLSRSGKVNSIQHYVINFIRFPPPIKLTAML